MSKARVGRAAAGDAAAKMDDDRAFALLKKYRLPVARYSIAKNERQAAGFARKLGYPVAMKVVSRDIVHKTDAGGIALGIGNEEALLKAYKEMMSNVKKKRPKARIAGVMLQEMVKEGHEVIIGAKRDTQFGPVIMFGMGGIFVEVLEDVTFRVAPIERRDAQEMIREIKTYKILEGARGQPPVKFAALEDALLAVSKLITKEKRVRELDINPLFISDKFARVADARVMV